MWEGSAVLARIEGERGFFFFSQPEQKNVQCDVYFSPLSFTKNPADVSPRYISISRYLAQEWLFQMTMHKYNKRTTVYDSMQSDQSSISSNSCPWENHQDWCSKHLSRALQKGGINTGFFFNTTFEPNSSGTLSFWKNFEFFGLKLWVIVNFLWTFRYF